MRVQDDLVVFMNVDIPGRTGHDFPNKFNEEIQTITWFGKPNTHTDQPTFKKLLSGEITPHFFARWEARSDFIYLGVGKIISMTDGFPTRDGQGNFAETVKVEITIQDAEEILSPLDTRENNENFIQSFALERNLEDFIVSNWDKTIFGRNYKIYEVDGEEVGKQFQTGMGPCDILAVTREGKEFLVIELKKGRASDAVVGQLTRYMGAIKKKLALNGENVRGTVIAYEDDKTLRSSLSVMPNIDFYAYKISFNLEKLEDF